jgi:16S rRNA (uracil1498-N3)-methyltransferase
MRLHRFYVLQPLGEEVVIDDVSLINQWTKVFRYSLGDFVILFNGDGHDYRYSLHTITKNSCTLTCREATTSYIPSQKITLCLSLIKKDNFELAVQKVTELGISTIIPILSSRSEKKNISIDRLHKIAVEASEQCGRGDVPLISPPLALQEILERIKEDQLGILLTMGGAPLITCKEKFADKDVLLFVGPEGGWSDSDLLLMREKNLVDYSLGKTVLRAETAAIVGASLLVL